jgi:hypothetical protein
MKNSSTKPSLFIFFYVKKFLIVVLLSGIDRLALGDHAAMSIDFKGEG